MGQAPLPVLEPSFAATDWPGAVCPPVLGDGIHSGAKSALVFGQNGVLP
jgi:hypothetical protein